MNNKSVLLNKRRYGVRVVEKQLDIQLRSFVFSGFPGQIQSSHVKSSIFNMVSISSRLYVYVKNCFIDVSYFYFTS